MTKASARTRVLQLEAERSIDAIASHDLAQILGAVRIDRGRQREQLGRERLHRDGLLIGVDRNDAAREAGERSRLATHSAKPPRPRAADPRVVLAKHLVAELVEAVADALQLGSPLSIAASKDGRQLGNPAAADERRPPAVVGRRGNDALWRMAIAVRRHLDPCGGAAAHTSAQSLTGRKSTSQSTSRRG